MEILSVTQGHVFLNEKCLWSAGGYYVGLKTGRRYEAAEHRHLPQLRAIIRAVDTENCTGMLHLFQGEHEENRERWKQQFIGCLVTAEAAHQNGDTRVYRVLELDGEYFSEYELEIIDAPAK